MFHVLEKGSREMQHMHTKLRDNMDRNRELSSYLPSRDIFSEFLIHNATDGHQKGVAGSLGCVVNPQVVLKILTVDKEKSVFPFMSKDTSY